MKNYYLKKPQNWEKIKQLNKQKVWSRQARKGTWLGWDTVHELIYPRLWLMETMQDPAALPFLLQVIFCLFFQCQKVQCSSVFSSILISFVIWLLTQIVNSEALAKTCKYSHSTRATNSLVFFLLISLHFYMVEQTNFVF